MASIEEIAWFVNMIRADAVIVFLDNGQVELHIGKDIDQEHLPEHVEYAQQVMGMIALDNMPDAESPEGKVH